MFLTKTIRYLSFAAAGIVLLITGFFALFYFSQDGLLFHPQPLNESRIDYVNEQYPEAKEVLTENKDGLDLHGWLIESGEDDPLLIYFGGNAEEVSYMIPDALRLENWNVLLMNYRGYGLSGGSPGEAEFFSDALTLYDEMTSEFGFESIAVMGRSMGTGPAVYLSEQRDVLGTVLVSPYDSLTRVAGDRYPLVPVSILLNHHFDNSTRAERIETPALVLIAENDEVIPPSHSEELVRSWDGDSEAVFFEGKHHNNIQTGSGYWTEITAFLDQFKQE
ncbi:hypothetical protein CR205_06440 [Alteribacter lacisalsi]|uniref:Alpha/beta hydrolase n=1 Tax=Alteribacter lacisalsi TaxID=2045244 RepID=A0A2W0HMX3_9BACI|nr:alpha/beta fold hydrolase [Alteribacter lacisalsi]PYZ98229.1 hypothetical protein CR205_06440 [Alteribacter lacisalsi]